LSDAKTTAIKPAAAPKPPSASVTILNSAASTVSKSKLRRRHVWLIMSFVLFVALPTAAAIFYLYQIAEDQFSSRVSFSIRSEQAQNPLDALSSLGQLSTGSSSDASILNEYLRSQKLVEDIQANIDLKAVYSKPEFDPVFAFNADKPIEDLVTYFQNMNYVTFDAGNGLLDVEAFAFSPDDAQMIATAIMNASSSLVERLSSIAQEDTTKNAKFELERARERLEQSRVTLGELRGREQIIDPRADLESQMGVLTALQSQLATALIEYDLLLTSTRETDPRLTAGKRKIEAIENRIEDERNKIGQIALNGGSSLATVVGDFESLMADREFAEKAYLAAAVTYDAALSEARRKSKYLAAHIPPTLAQSSQYPNRTLWALAFFGGCLLIWSVAMLTVYAMLDRR
jgi:capsular polysaccharide transport system permease protein